MSLHLHPLWVTKMYCAFQLSSDQPANCTTSALAGMVSPCLTWMRLSMESHFANTKPSIFFASIDTNTTRG